MSEIGIIGQLYEDRRTKKQGKLLERDAKFKTLLMESSDGKSFNITYGGFKSNWRKVEEELPPEESFEEIPVVEQKVDEESEAPKKKQKERNVSKGLEDTTLRILDYAESFNDVNISSSLNPKKRSVTLKAGKRRMFILTYQKRNNNFQVCTYEDLYLRVANRPYARCGQYNETWLSMKYSFLMDYDKLDEFLEDARSYVIDYMCGEVKEN